MPNVLWQRVRLEHEPECKLGIGEHQDCGEQPNPANKPIEDAPPPEIQKSLDANQIYCDIHVSIGTIVNKVDNKVIRYE